MVFNAEGKARQKHTHSGRRYLRPSRGQALRAAPDRRLPAAAARAAAPAGELRVQVGHACEVAQRRQELRHLLMGRALHH